MRKTCFLKLWLLLICVVAASGAWATVYEKITSTAGLEAGANYLLVYESGESSQALGSISTIGSGVMVNATGSSITITDQGVNVLTLVASSTKWKFQPSLNTGKYLHWSSGNTLTTDDTGSEWTIAFDNGNAIIKHGTTTTRKLQWNSSSPRFACYTSSQTAVALYKEAAPKYALTFTAASAGGTISVTKSAAAVASGAEFEAGTVLDIVATPADGYDFTSWSAAGATLGSATSATTTLTMPAAAVTLTATFTAQTIVSNINVNSCSNGTIAADKATANVGETVTLTATPDAGYALASWIVLDGNADEVTVTPTGENTATFVMPASDVEVGATFAAKHTITWNVLGVANSETVLNGTPLVFPEAPTPASLGLPSTYQFMGWSASSTVEADGSDFVAAVEGSAVTASANYYAVFANGIATYSLTKLGSSDTFVAGDKIVLVAKGTTFGMKQETVNKTYVANFTFDSKAATIAANDKYWWTLTAGSNGKWKLGDATNGYLYNNGTGNELYSDPNNQADWTIAWNSNESAFTLSTGRYLTLRSDLDSANKNLWRCLASLGSGINYIDIYRFTANLDYENYCTSYKETVTVTSAGFATYVSQASLDYTDVTGLEAFRATIDGNTVKFNKVTKVPAGEGVLLKGAADDYEVPLAADAAAIENDFIAGTGAAVDSEEDGKYNFILNVVGGQVGFYAANGQTVATNRAYLQTTTAPASARLQMVFGDETTGIATVTPALTEGEGVIVDLQGRRVARPTKGLYIVNGKKAIFK